MEGGAWALQNSAHTPQIPLARAFQIYFCRGRRRRKRTAEPRENPEELLGPGRSCPDTETGPESETSPRPPEGQGSVAAGPPGSPRVSAPPPATLRPRRLFFVSRGHHGYGSRRLPAAPPPPAARGISPPRGQRGPRPRWGAGRVGSGLGTAPERGTSLREAAAGRRPHGADLASGTGQASRPHPGGRPPPAGRASVSSPGKWAPCSGNALRARRRRRPTFSPRGAGRPGSPAGPPAPAPAGPRVPAG